jgi:two-component system sensor histidine kinase PilS (NtrC family)
MIIASLCSVCYGLLLDLEYYRIVPVGDYVHFQFYDQRAGHVFTRIVTYIVSFYIITFLASFVVERERRARTLLAEKRDGLRPARPAPPEHHRIRGRRDRDHEPPAAGQVVQPGGFATHGIPLPDRGESEHQRGISGFAGAAGLADNRNPGGVPRSRFEMPFRGSDREEMILGCAISPLKDKRDRRIGHILVFQDLTAIRRMEESVEKSGAWPSSEKWPPGWPTKSGIPWPPSPGPSRS